MAVKSLARSGLITFDKYSSMLAGNEAFEPSAYDLLDTQILSSAAASVTLNGLSAYASSYRHLQVRWSGAGFSTYGDFYMFFNGDGTQGNYYSHQTYGGGGGPGLGSGGNAVFNYQWNGGSNATIIDIADAFQTTKFKTSRGISTNTLVGAGVLFFTSHVWRNTAAISSITFSNVRQNIPAGTRFSVYGIKVA